MKRLQHKDPVPVWRILRFILAIAFASILIYYLQYILGMLLIELPQTAIHFYQGIDD